MLPKIKDKSCIILLITVLVTLLSILPYKIGIYTTRPPLLGKVPGSLHHLVQYPSHLLNIGNVSH